MLSFHFIKLLKSEKESKKDYRKVKNKEKKHVRGWSSFALELCQLVTVV
jgi:hypothetical protein